MRSMHGQRPVVVPGIPARLAALALLANVREIQAAGLKTTRARARNAYLVGGIPPGGGGAGGLAKLPACRRFSSS